MINWLITRPKTIRLLSIGVSVFGYLLFLFLAEITYDLPILLPLFGIATLLGYLVGYSWPFILATIIQANRHWLNSTRPKEESRIRFLLWIALISLVIAPIPILLGSPINALGLSGVCGLLAGSCQYLNRHHSPDKAGNTRCPQPFQKIEDD